ncbi:YihY/virulence factor BrkB family protein [Novosphingobium flavum]|uniref:YihY/virulence factor BrkB family protein n=1 Tax=Novosphingobium flavum TaxID=1778672 RepID=A0A7X1KKH1_9SPHN|nr:YihY/virulence factor BrkB family protein [Novosphingobium flavum]MBC2664497.1 YihY/virulence factor BrkB family protein [Novosphingobium flavum]
MEERPIVGAGAADQQTLLDPPDLSPEARRRHAQRWQQGLEPVTRSEVAGHRDWHAHVRQVLGRTLAGVWNDGFIHAGNLAYTAVVALFPFFILAAAVFSAIGEKADRAASINAFLLAVPPAVAKAIAPVARDVIEARTGWLLWIGGVVGIWSVGSLVETIRDVLRRAYGTKQTHAFWRYRLLSTGITFAAVILLLLSLMAQVTIGAVETAIYAWFPRLDPIAGEVAMTRLIPAGVLFASLYLLFLSLTPSQYRKRAYPKWPGALFVTVWWVLVLMALPWAIRHLFNYDATYGSLAGVMITLFFFWLVGLGMVFGAELNAALAETPEERDMIGQADDRNRQSRMRNGGVRTE